MKVGDNWGGGISKARRVEAGLSSWEGAASPHQLGGLGKRCGLPSGVRGGAPVAQRFPCILSALDGFSPLHCRIIEARSSA